MKMIESWVMYLLDYFDEKGERSKCDVVCVEHLQMIGLMVVMLMSYSRVLSVVLILCAVGPILRNGHEVSGQKVR